MAGVTDVGRRRDHNEDTIVTDAGLGLAVLADGMGGYKGGEVASALAANVLVEEVRRKLRWQEVAAVDEQTGYTRASLLIRDAISRANDSIYRTAHEQPHCQGMGTTLVSLLFYDNRLSVGHVGDSRLYRVRGEEIQQLTVDHSLMQELVDRGFYTPEQARRHAVPPGITGWAQVNGRNALSWEEKFALDVWYVDHQSLALDIRILWLTARKVLAREGISAAGEATMGKFTGNP